MTLSQAVGTAMHRKPSAFTEFELTDWINQLEDRIYSEVWGVPERFRVPLKWEGDENKPLFLTGTDEELYIAWLCYKIDFANGEFDTAANTGAMFNDLWNGYNASCANRYDPHGVPKWRQWTDAVSLGADKIRERAEQDITFEIEISRVPSLLLEVVIEVGEGFNSGESDRLNVTVGGEETVIDLGIPVTTHILSFYDAEAREKMTVHYEGEGELPERGYVNVQLRRLINKEEFRGRW